MPGSKTDNNSKAKLGSPVINPFLNHEHLTGEKVSYGGLNDKRYVSFGLFDAPASPTERPPKKADVRESLVAPAQVNR